MNESNSEVLVKKNIVMYAKKIRDIQNDQINPYMELIEKNLAELYPSLVDRDDGVENWACDIVNASSNAEVIETLDRVEQILEKEFKDKWVCCVCGENTYNVDSDYLSGIDHLSCILEEESKENTKTESNDQMRELKNQLGNLQTYVKQLEQQLEKLEKHYNEPTN
jgi:hypothetical protein